MNSEDNMTRMKLELLFIIIPELFNNFTNNGLLVYIDVDTLTSNYDKINDLYFYLHSVILEEQNQCKINRV